MIMDAFLDWTQHAPREQRLEAADALARCFLRTDLDEAERRRVLTSLFALLDDPCVSVRERLASIFADRLDAPRALVLRLVDDVPAVCAALYARSPLLQAPHLLDGVQRGEARIGQAIAGRADLHPSIMDNLLAVGCVDTCTALISNPYIRLSEDQISGFIARFGRDVEALETLQATRNLSPEHQCLLVAACAQAYQGNAFVQALVPGKRLDRLTEAARERAVLDLLAQMDANSAHRAIGALYGAGGLTPAFALRVALCGHVPALEALVACLCSVSMERVRSAFVHPRPVVAASLLKKTNLSAPVCSVLSMSLVLARELARSDVEWTSGFFAETLIEVVDQRGAQALYDGVGEGAVDEATSALCHSIAADILQADARAAVRPASGEGLDALDVDHEDALLIESALADALAA